MLETKAKADKTRYKEAMEAYTKAKAEEEPEEEEEEEESESD